MRTVLPFLIVFYFSCLNAQQVEPIVQYGHSGKNVTEIVLSSDGEMMATTDGETLLLWDMTNGLTFNMITSDVQDLDITTFKKRIRLHSIHFTADNESIIYNFDGDIIIRNITTNQQKTLEIDRENTSDETHNKQNPNAQKAHKMMDFHSNVTFNHQQGLVALKNQQVVKIKNYQTNKDLYEITLEDNTQKDTSLYYHFMPFQFSPNGKLLTSNGLIYEVASGKVRYRLDEMQGGLEPAQFAFSPDRKFLAQVFRTPFEEVMDGFKNGNSFEEMTRKLDSLNKIVKPFLIIQNLETGEIVNQIETTAILSLSYSPDGAKIATGHTNGIIRIWNWQTGEEYISIQKTIKEEKSSPFNFNSNPVNSICFTADGNGIISAGNEEDKGNLLIWSVKDGSIIRKLGAAIPPITIEPKKSTRDSLLLVEVEETFYQPWQFIKEREEKGLRLIDLRSGQVPHAYPREDSIQLSPYGSLYLVMKTGEPVKVFETELDEHISTLTGSMGNFNQFIMDDINKLIAGVKEDAIWIWNASNGKIKHQLEGHHGKLNTVAFDVNGTTMASASADDEIHFWSLGSGEKLGTYKPLISKGKIDSLKNTTRTVRTAINTGREIFDKIPTKIKIPGRGRKKKNSNVPKILQKAEKTENRITQTDSLLGLIPYNGFYELEFSQDGRFMAAWSKNRYSVEFFDLEEMKFKKDIKSKKSKEPNKVKPIRTIRDPFLMLMQRIVLGKFDQEQLEQKATEIESDSIQIFSFDDVAITQLLQHFMQQFNLKNRSCFSPNFEYFARINKKRKAKKATIDVETIKKEGVFKNKTRHTLAHSEDFKNGLQFSPDGSMIAAANTSKNIIRLWNTETRDTIKTLRGHSGKIDFGPRGKTLISTGLDRRVIIWDIATSKPLYTFIGIKGSNDYIVMLPSGYYTTSRRESKAVAFGIGKKAYPFEQFDLQYNRPDLLLNTIGTSILNKGEDNPNEELTQAYHRAYQKRLSKMGFKEGDFSNVVHLPEVSVAKLPITTNNKNISISIDAEDENYKLAILHIWVNDVPIFGKAGKNLRPSSSNRFVDNISLELSNGQNKVQVAVLNTKGGESLKTTHFVEYKGQAIQPNLYFVTLGASIFKNADMNLEFPAKDLNDLSTFWLNDKANKYQNIYKYPLINEDFTLENLAQIKEKLKGAKVDDEVIIYIATHGVLSPQLDYYLATYDMDFGAPGKLGLSYESLEEILDIIKARSKLVFIDACHAGEIDLERLQQKASNLSQDGNITFRKFRSSSWTKLSPSNSLELMKSLFVDLRRGTGATVIAAAGAAEFAIEGEEWNNSVFLYSLLKGLKTGNADRNKDGIIRVSELQEYLPKIVSRLTNGAQKPTYRTENIGNDWRVW